jgi:hypothetical protein
MPSALRTLEQERAKHAWDCVQEVKDKHKHIADVSRHRRESALLNRDQRLRANAGVFEGET